MGNTYTSTIISTVQAIFPGNVVLAVIMHNIPENVTYRKQVDILISKSQALRILHLVQYNH